MEVQASQNYKDARVLFQGAWIRCLDVLKASCTPPSFESLEGAYCEKALGFIPKRFWLRKKLLLLTHMRIFEMLVLLAIAANCITLALDSNAPDFQESRRGRQLRIADYVFTGFFTLEMLLKIVALGLIAAPNTYMRSGWNLLDMAIIGTGYISIAGFANVTALRGIRALRPLRTITRIKEMKVVVASMISSLPALFDVTLLMSLFFAIFGTMGVLLLGGQLQNRCADPDFSHAFTDELGFVQGVRYIVGDDDKEDVCRNTFTGDVQWLNTTLSDTGEFRLVPTHTKTSRNGWANDCDFTPSPEHPHGQFCTPFKNPEADDFPDDVPGYNSFDNILLSWIIVFQHVTMTDWAFVMYNVQDGVNWWTWVLHFFMNFMGGMLLINLIVAVIFMNFQKSMSGQDDSADDPEMSLLKDWPADSAPAEPMLYSSPSIPASQHSQLHKRSGPMAEGVAEGPVSGAGRGAGAAIATEFSAHTNGAAHLDGHRHYHHHWQRQQQQQHEELAVAAQAQEQQLAAAAQVHASGLPSRSDLDSAHHALHKTRNQKDAKAPNEMGTDSFKRSFKKDLGSSKNELGSLGDKLSPVQLPAFPSLKFEEEQELESLADMLRRMSSTQGGQPLYNGKMQKRLHEMQAKQMQERKLQALVTEGRDQKTLQVSHAWAVFRVYCLYFVMLPQFGLFNALVIFLNAIVLGLNWYLMPPKMERAMTIINYAFTCYFVVEIIVRLIARGADFFTTRMNWFDFVVTLAGFAEMLVDVQPGPQEARFNGGLTAIRLLRLFRLARYWDGLNEILVVLGYAFSSGIYLFMLVLLFMFIAGLLGMQLFGHKNAWCGEIEGATQRCPPGESCPDHRECYVDCLPSQLGHWFEVDESPYNEMAYCERFPRNYDPNGQENHPSWPLYWAQVGKPERLRAHFDTMLHAFITVFIIITCDNWTDIMFPMMSAINPWIAVYFVIVITLGTFMLLQLFLAILLGGLDKLEEKKEQERARHGKAARRQSSISNLLSSTASSLGISLKRHDGSSRFGSIKLRFSLSPPQMGPVPVEEQKLPPKLFNSDVEEVAAAEAAATTVGAAAPVQPISSSATKQAPLAPPRLASMLQRNNKISPSNSMNAARKASFDNHFMELPLIYTHSHLAHPHSHPHVPHHHRHGSAEPMPMAEATATNSNPELPSSAPPSAVPSSYRHTDQQPDLPPAPPPAPPFLPLLDAADTNNNHKLHHLPSLATPSSEHQRTGVVRLPPVHRSSANLSQPVGPSARNEAAPQREGGGGGGGSGSQGEGQTSSPARPSRPRMPSFGGMRLSPSLQVGEQLQVGESSSVIASAGAGGGVAEVGTDEESLRVENGGWQGRGQAVGEAHELPLKKTLSSTQFSWLEPGLPSRPSCDVSTGGGSHSRQAHGLRDPSSKSLSELCGRGSGGQSLLDVRARRNSCTANSAAREKEAEEGQSALCGHACFCLGPNNPFRKWVAKVVNHMAFIYFINAMVLVSCVILMLDVVSLDRTSKKGIVLRNLDAATTAIFGLEVVLRSIHLGVLFNGPSSYLRNGWNQWDVFVVAISVVVLSIDASNVETFTWLAALRALRALRVLHAASYVEGINVVLKALGKLIPTLTNVLWVGLLFYYIFAVLGVALLSGRMHYCAEDGGGYLDPYNVLPEGETISKAWCEASDSKRDGFRMINTSHYHSRIGVEVPPYELTTSWTRDLRRFDNVITAMWVLYQMASVELWSEIMFDTQAAVGRETQPIAEANEHIGLLWVLFMFIGSFTLLSLIVGVSINKFHEMKVEANGQSPLLTQQQQQWITVQHMLASTTIEDLTIPSANKFRHFIHKLVYNKLTDAFLMFIIMANTIVMFFAHYDMSKEYEQAINITNTAVTAIFAVEFAAKLIAVGPCTYFKSNWNTFDAIITVLSIIGVLIDNLSNNSVAFLPVLRILRVVRILRLIPRAKGLRKLMRTLYWSFPAVSNVAFVLIVFMYLWAIAGMNLFGNIKLTDNEAGNNRHRNFRHFPISMITLFTMLSGEDWNDLMQDCMQKEDCWLVKEDVSFTMPGGDGSPVEVELEGGNYLDPVDDHVVLGFMRSDSFLKSTLKDECTINATLAALYHCIFMLVCSYIMIQLVIGIILDNIQAASIMEDSAVGQDDVNNFVAAWEDLDPFGTSYISVTQITTLLSNVPPPLGIQNLPQMQKRAQEIILDVDIPLRRGMRVHFLEVLHALAGRVAGAEVPVEEELHIHNHLVKKIPKGIPSFTAAHAYAAMAVAGAVRGHMQRMAVKDVWQELDKEDMSLLKAEDEEGVQARLMSLLESKGKSISPAEAQVHVRRLAAQGLASP